MNVNLGPRESLPCPHEDCVYRDNMVNGRRCVWLRINDDDAMAIVDACENAHPHRATMIIKRQPWYPGMVRSVRQLDSKLDLLLTVKSLPNQ